MTDKETPKERTATEKVKAAGKDMAETGKKHAATIGLATAGLVFGGPLGAALGGGIGYVVDKVRQD